MLRRSTGFFRHRQLEDSSRRNDPFQCQELPSPWLRQQKAKTEPQPPAWGGLLFGGGWARTGCLGTPGHCAQVSGMLPSPAKLRPEHLGPSTFYAFCSKTCFCKYIQHGRNTCQCTGSSIFMKKYQDKVPQLLPASKPAMSTWLVVKKLFVARTTGRSGLCVKLFLHCSCPDAYQIFLPAAVVL